MKTSTPSRLGHLQKIGALSLAMLVGGSPLGTQAADIFWTGVTASYTNAANWAGGVVPGTGDNAINTNGLGNVVQINAGNPDWVVTDISAGGVTDGAGAFQQNGQTVGVNGWMLLGSGNNATGIYTLNGGTLNVLGGRIFLGGNPNSTSALNINGGTVNKTGEAFVVADGGSNGTSSRTGTVNQVSGTVNSSSELWVGQFGDGVGIGYGIYNLSGGTLNVSNWLALGRSGGNGKVTMTGGVLNKYGNGNFLVGTGFQTPSGGSGVAELTQSGGTINCSGEFSVPENSPSSGTYNLSSAGVLNVASWMQIGRSGGTGLMNMSGGSVTKTGGGNFIVGDNATGVLNQSAGTIEVNNEAWVGQGGSGNGTYNLSGGSITNHNWFAIGRAGGTGVVNFTNGVITRADGGNFAVGSGGSGTLNQYGGILNNTPNAGSVTYLAEAGGTGTWNMYGGVATLGLLQFCQGGNGNGTLNFNGGLISASEVNCGVNGANGTIFFNGGTLQARSDNVNFFNGLGAAYVQAGGAVIDSQGFNIAVAQSLLDNGGGGLTKTGSGTLTLTGGNSYTGPTVVSAGTLAVRTDATANGDYSVASGAQLSVTVLALNGQLNTANATFASGTPALAFDLGAFGNPTSAPLNVSGTLAVNGAVTVNITDTLPQLGQIPLIQYGARSGSGSFVLGTIPVGVIANIATNGNSIVLNITTVNLPRWEGLAGGNWDIGLTTNWVNIGDGLPTFYGQGNAVEFNDSALGTTTVNLTTTLNPSKVLINNSSLAYTLNGTGKISGSTGLTKQGTGVATISNTGGNNYTGPTVISGGALSVASLANGGAASAIGASSASPTNLVLAGGTLDYTGPTTSINRGYSVQAAGSGISVQNTLTLSGSVTAISGGGFTKAGLGQINYAGTGSNLLSGTGSAGYAVTDGGVRFEGVGGSQTNLVQGSLLANGAAGNATVRLTNSVVSTTSDAGFGQAANTAGALVLDTNSVLNVGSWFLLGDGTNAVATATINGGTLNVPNGRLFLCSAPGTIATLNINGGVINKNGDYFAVVNGGWNSTGARTGVVNQVNGTVGGGSEMWVGDGGGVGGNDSLGIYNLSGGSLTVNNWFGVGRDGCRGVFNLAGGTFNKGGGGDMVIGRGGNGTIGTFNMSGGTLNKGNNNPLIVGQDGGQGVFNQSAGAVDSGNEFWVGQGGGGVGTYNMSGGTLNIHHWVAIGRGGGNGTFNLWGGALAKDGEGRFIVGDNSQGLLNQTNGTLTIGSELWIGQWHDGSGTYNMSGGTLTVSDWLAVGREGADGILNITGGSIIKQGGGNIPLCHGHDGNTASAVVQQSGGSFTALTGELWIGEDTGTAVYNLDGGTASFGWVQIARNNNVTGTLNLNGGIFAATEITSGSGSSTLNLNGGTLAANNGANANFLHDLTAANVLAGGLTVDTGTNIIGVAQSLIDGGGNGGLTKNGTGTLRLNGVNTYTGLTAVNTGTLGGTGTIAGSLTVASGATFAPGLSIGTFTVGGAVTLSAGSTNVMELSKNAATNDLVTGATSIAYGGTLVLKNQGGVLVVNDTFKLFNASSYSGSFSAVVSQVYGQIVTWDTSNLTVDGTVRVASVVAAPVQLISLVSGNNLNLSWPVDQLGWRLEVQTNALTVGLNTNWFTVANSTNVTAVSAPIVPGNPTVFYRLVYP